MTPIPAATGSIAAKLPVCAKAKARAAIPTKTTMQIGVAISDVLTVATIKSCSAARISSVGDGTRAGAAPSISVLTGSLLGGSSCHDPPGGQGLEDRGCRRGGGDLGAAHHQLRRLGGLVRVVDAGEPGQLTGPGSPVEALRVAGLAHVEGRVDEDLEEHQAARLVDSPGLRPACSVGADEGGADDEAGVGEEPSDLADPTDVLGPVRS